MADSVTTRATKALRSSGVLRGWTASVSVSLTELFVGGTALIGFALGAGLAEATAASVALTLAGATRAVRRAKERLEFERLPESDAKEERRIGLRRTAPQDFVGAALYLIPYVMIQALATRSPEPDVLESAAAMLGGAAFVPPLLLIKEGIVRIRLRSAARSMEGGPTSMSERSNKRLNLSG